jgi:hypothetical protein
MRDVSDKICKGNQNKNFKLNNIFRHACRLWGNVDKYVGEDQATDENITGSIRLSCWITKATDTH